MADFPGHPALGRGIVISGVASAPSATSRWRRVVIDEAAIAGPAPLAVELRHLWLHREPVVIELAVDPASLRQAEHCDLPPWSLSPSHDFSRELLQFLVWSNNYDGRDPAAPIWWHARRAVALGATAITHADVVLPDGSEAWCDGGPRGPVPEGEHLVIVHRETIEAGSLAPDGHKGVTSELAEDQLAAVAHGTGPARVIAPAGSGKTRVLTERLRHLLSDRGVTPSSVLAVAFNKRAADELVERTSGLGAEIRTLNALGLAIVNGTRPFSPSGEAPRQMIGEREVREILQQLFTVRRQANTDPWLAYLEALSVIRLGLVSPAAVEEAMPDAAGIAEGFDRYREVLAERRLLDFDEQIYLAIERLLCQPELRREAQSHARHLLVDEFQDLNPAHLLMIRLLAAPTFDVFGVGDDDQVIYSYAGATPEFLINYERYFPGAVPYGLERNYRCPPAVVEATRSLLSHNRRRIAKAISAADGDSSPLRLRVESQNSERHASAALVEILRWRAAGSEWSEIAALARVNSALLPLQVTLAEHGVPCTAPLGVEVLNRTGIRAALAYLRIGAAPDHIGRADIAETIRRPSRKIARNVTELLQRRANTSIEGIRDLASALSGNDVAKLEEYANDLELVANSIESGTTAQVLETIRTGIGLGSAMEVLDTAKHELDRSTHLDDLAALEQVAALHPEVSTFEPWLRSTLTSPAAGQQEETPGGLLTLSTVHRVKGQEWPHVLVLGASADLFPHRLSQEIEEERRIFHVAITRCSNDVVIIADAERPSPFCRELVDAAPELPVGPAPPGDQEDRLERLRRNRQPKNAPPEKTPARLDRDGDGPEERLARSLREWRRATAERDAVPAYIVLSDAHLDGIAQARPESLAALMACRGIGPAKLERYGDEILAIVDAAATVS